MAKTKVISVANQKGGVGKSNKLDTAQRINLKRIGGQSPFAP